jgi:hypothetical protein
MSDTLLKTTLDAAGMQVEKVLDGMPETSMDARLTAEGMTPRQILQHLTECYVAFKAEASGGSHEWGTYASADQSTVALFSDWKRLRSEAADLALGSADPKLQEKAMDFMALHDAYHVGQLCLIRLQAQPDWNIYSIYGF